MSSHNIKSSFIQRPKQKNPNLLPMLLLYGFIISYIYVFYLIGKNVKIGIIDNIGNQNKVKLLGEFLTLFISFCVISITLFYRYRRGSDEKSEQYKNADKKYLKLFLFNIGIFFGLCAICYFDENIKDALK